MISLGREFELDLNEDANSFAEFFKARPVVIVELLEVLADLVEDRFDAFVDFTQVRYTGECHQLADLGTDVAGKEILYRSLGFFREKVIEVYADSRGRLLFY